MALTTIGLSTGWGPSVAAAEDVQFYAIAEKEEGSRHFLHLDGLVFHSSLAVERVDVVYQGDAAIVEVRLIPTGKGLSGSFVTDVQLRPTTKRVLFGTTRQEIWQSRSR